MSLNTCKSCKYFRQHYVKFGKRYNACGGGHCVFPKVKPRRTDSPACGYFEARKTVPIHIRKGTKSTPEH